MELHNLTSKSEWISKNFDVDSIEMNKKMSRIIKQAREMQKEKVVFIVEGRWILFAILIAYLHFVCEILAVMELC